MQFRHKIRTGSSGSDLVVNTVLMPILRVCKQQMRAGELDCAIFTDGRALTVVEEAQSSFAVIRSVDPQGGAMQLRMR